MGIINTGTAVGMVAAPPLIALVLGAWNWRAVFVLTGALGLLWTLVWHRDYFPPDSHPRLGAVEREEIGSVLVPRAGATLGLPWLQLLRFRQTWGIVIAKFLSDAAWYFILFWLPKYLYDARGFDIKAVGSFAWIPPVAAGVGCLAGGSLSSRLLARQLPLDRARKIALGASALLMPLVLFVPRATAAAAIALFSVVAYFAQQSWSTLVMVLPADIYPRPSVGAVAGLVGFGGAMGGVVFGQVVGYLLDHGFGYGLVFALAGSCHVAAFAVLCLFLPRIEPLALANGGHS